jgi:hypothetical protein
MKRILVWVTCCVALTVSSPARANMIYLQCGSDSLTVDLTNNTVNRLPANVTATAIYWEYRSPTNEIGYAITYNHIDRAAGTHSNHTLYFLADGHNEYGAGKSNQRCAVSRSPPPTKF